MRFFSALTLRRASFIRLDIHTVDFNGLLVDAELWTSEVSQPTARQLLAPDGHFRVSVADLELAKRTTLVVQITHDRVADRCRGYSRRAHSGWA